MHAPRALGIVVALICAGSTAARATDTTTTPYPGLELLHRKTASQDIHVLFVDLCTPGVRIRATRHAERGRTVSSFATLVGAKAAINANFYNLTTFETTGPAMGDGEAWGGADGQLVAPVQFGPYRVALPADVSTAGLAGWAREVVSGRPSLVVAGTARDASAASTCDARNPRTGLGLSADRETLILAAVDGRRTDALGMTCNELGRLLQELGAADAINLDGGGSTTMWLAGSGVVNQPSDGTQRVVGNHLAVLVEDDTDAPSCPRARLGASAVRGDGGLELASGQSASVMLELRNDSNVAWDDTVELGAQAPADRASAFASAGWLGPSRVTSTPLTEPGATGPLTWTMTAPEVAETTTFTEAFQLVRDDVWFGPVQVLEIVVQPAVRDDDGDLDAYGGCAAAGARRPSPLALLLALALLGRARGARASRASRALSRSPRARSPRGA